MLLPVAANFADEVQAIRDVFLEGHAARDVECDVLPYCPLDDGCVVSLWDAWNRYMRNLYLTSAAGESTGVSGTVYAPAVARTEPESLSELRAAARLKGSGIALAKDEPKWFMTSSVYAIASCLGLANGSVIANALTQTNVLLGGGFWVPIPLEEIRRVRNYIAHKSRGVAESLLQEMGPGVSDLSGYLRQPTRGGSTRFDDWCDALIGLAWDAAL